MAKMLSYRKPYKRQLMRNFWHCLSVVTIASNVINFIDWYLDDAKGKVIDFHVRGSWFECYL